jgi:hypothetical protein
MVALLLTSVLPIWNVWFRKPSEARLVWETLWGVGWDVASNPDARFDTANLVRGSILVGLGAAAGLFAHCFSLARSKD